MAKKEESTSIKLQEEETTKIAEFQKSRSNVQMELGNLALVRIDVENKQKELESFLATSKEEEVEFVKELETKYGIGSIDVQKGEFTPTAE